MFKYDISNMFIFKPIYKKKKYFCKRKSNHNAKYIYKKMKEKKAKHIFHFQLFFVIHKYSFLLLYVPLYKEAKISKFRSLHITHTYMIYTSHIQIQSTIHLLLCSIFRVYDGAVFHFEVLYVCSDKCRGVGNACYSGALVQ